MKLGYKLYIYVGCYLWTFIKQHIYLLYKRRVINTPEKTKNSGEHEKRDNINTWV